MFAKKESALWSLVRTNLKKAFLLTRIESVATPGVPDVYLVDKATGSSCWVELKILRGNKPRMGPEQVSWISRHSHTGLNIKILARKDDTLYLWKGVDLAEIVKRGIDVVCPRWTKPFDWADISKHIIRN